MESRNDPAYREFFETKRAAGVEPLLTSLPGAPPAVPPGEAFGKHFLRCFFCHIGDRYTSDHFCEEGRELIVALLDEVHDREFNI